MIVSTFTDRELNLAAPDPGMICLLDIATGLSRACRFSGQCREFYSVAQHSVAVSRDVPAEMAMWGLMHDAAEAYTGDIPGPLKTNLPGMEALEAGVLSAVAARFSMSPPSMPDEVKKADARALLAEAAVLMPRGARNRHFRSECAALDLRIHPLPHGAAKELFLYRFLEIAGKAEFDRQMQE